MTQDSLDGVFAVPPLARKPGRARAIDFEQNSRIVRYIANGGISRFIYGGNAFLYHLTLDEYEQLLEWQAEIQRDGLWLIPSAGPSYGRLMDQAKLLRRFAVPCVMTLPCADPRDAAGLERGLREFAEAADANLMLYLKEETNMGANLMAGLDVVARLVDEGVCIAIKYAVVRADPTQDPYLDELVKRVDRRKVISGIGERPAVIHLRQWGLPGFTTGSGCLAPTLERGSLLRLPRRRLRRSRTHPFPFPGPRRPAGCVGTSPRSASCAGARRRCCHRAYSSFRFRTFSGANESSKTCGAGTLDPPARVGCRGLRGQW